MLERYCDLFLLASEDLRKSLTVQLKEEVFFPKGFRIQAMVGIVGEW